MPIIPRFIQIHTLHSHPAALLNRDDSGLAKRMPFGDAVRTRVSSQSLKRHWRDADSEFALANIDGFVEAVRSRKVISDAVMPPLRNDSAASKGVLDAVESVFQEKVYSGSGIQPLLLGLPEVEFLRAKAAAICGEHGSDAAAAKTAAEDLFHTRRGEGNNFRAFRDQTKLPGGLIGALFGRMVTSDPAANIDAAIHVAHALTVHAEESESDYFTTVDDLRDLSEDSGPGAGHIGDVELTAGLFYGYVVVDVPGLVSNLEGCGAGDWLADDTNREMAAKVVEHLLHLIATVSPGAKLGSTAPYAYADLMLVEAGSRQPRTLSNAFRGRVAAQTDAATDKMASHLGKLDKAYGAREARRVMSVNGCEMPEADCVSMDELAAWTADSIRNGEAV